MTGSGAGSRASAGAVYVAAFGKHPGWNDHIDDLGVETPRLVEVKRRLYVEGIGGNIDSGAWDKLEPAQQVEGFAHVFVWRRPGDIVVGRMWSSTDGKGRAKYPMIVCAECVGLPLSWAVEQALPKLEEVEAQCRAVSDAAAVRSVLDSARSVLRRRAGGVASDAPELEVSDRTWADLADHPSMGPARVGVHRLLYQIEREMGDYLPVGRDSAVRARPGEASPQHVRVPACAAGAGQEVSLWLGAMLAQLSPAAEVGVFLPLGQGWVDVLVGSPDGPQFFFLRATPKAVPLVTDIPYTLDAEFVSRAERRIAEGRAATPRVILAQEAQAQAQPGLLSRLMAWSRRRTGLLLGVAAGTAAVLAGVGLMARSCSSPPGSPPPPPRLADAPPTRIDKGGPLPGSPESTGDFDPEPWRELVGKHRRWFAVFLRRLDEPPNVSPAGTAFPTRRALYATDPALSALLSTLDAARSAGPIDPLTIAGLSRGDLLSLERTPPESVRTESASTAVSRALKVARGFAEAFNGGWPVIGSLKAAAESFERHGWGDAAAYLRASAEAVTLGEGKDVAPAVDAAITAARAAESVSARLDRIAGQDAALAATGDPILKAYQAWALGSVGAACAPGAAGLAAMDAAAGKAEELGGRLASFVARDWEAVDHDAFAASRVRAEFRGQPTWETFERWLFEVKDYPSLDPALNPTRKEDATRRLAEIDALARTLAADFGVSLADGEKSRIESLRARVGELSALPWNRANQERMVAGSAQVRRELDEEWEGLNGRLDRARAERVGNAREARDRLRAKDRVVASSDAINAAWSSWRDRLLAEYPDDRYSEMLAHAGELEGALGEFSRSMAGSFSVGADAAAWSAALTEAVSREREKRITAALEPWRARTPTADDVRRVLGAVSIDFAGWVGQAEALAAGLGVMEGLLRGAYGTAEAAPDGSVLGEAAKRVAASPVLSDAAVASAVRPILGRVESIRRAEQEADPAVLGKVFDDAGAERGAVVAAWRRLGAIPGRGGPGTVEELRTEARALGALTRIADAIDDQARSAALKAEAAREGSARWKRCFGVLRDAGGIEAAAGLMDQFGVTAEAIEDARLRFNAIAARSKLAFAGGMSDAEASGAAGSLAGSIRALPGMAARAGVAGLLGELDRIASGQEPPTPTIDVTTLGPGSVGWRGQAEGDRVRFTRDTPDGSVTIEFFRIEATGGVADPFYLGTEEVSVGVVGASLSSSAAVAKFASLTSGLDKLGPLGWMATEAGFSYSSDWVKYPAGTGPGDYPELAAAGRPARAHPIQRVSPAGALYVARLLGCRFPTPAEWRAAAATVTTFRPEEWNFRDARWQREQDAAAAVRRAGKVALWPDLEVFWPAKFDSASASGASAKAVNGAFDDGFLLFSPVSAGPDRPLKHLYGNVWEYTFDPGSGGGEGQWPDPKDPVGVQKFIQDHAGSLAVMGGSALSSPALDLMHPQAVDEFDIADRLGYSDVGFRLAFGAKGAAPPRIPVAAQVVKLIGNDSYLLPE
jgi:hypothetical protein